VTTQTSSGFVETTSPDGAWIDRAKTAIIDVLFPPHCAACHRPGAWLCVDCLQAMQVIQPPVCQRCGLPLDEHQTARASQSICKRCQRAPLQLDGLLAYAFHSGPLRQAIHQFKYKDLRSLAAPLGQLMAEGWRALAPEDLQPDVIVPVPLHPSRQLQRGYNQATLLAQELGSRLRCPVMKEVLVRIKATAPQVDLDAQERRDNVRNAFRCRDTSLAGKHVLLIDDVCTTGSTLESACVALREIGVISVWAYTLARAKF
jgi:ComF family protein